MKTFLFILFIWVNVQADPINPYVVPTNAVDWSRMTSLYNFSKTPVDKTNEAGQPIVSMLRKQPNWTILVHSPEPCPQAYTNTISNTNLLSLSEQAFLNKFMDRLAGSSKPATECDRSKAGNGYDVSYDPPGTWPPPELVNSNGVRQKHGSVLQYSGSGGSYKSFLFIQQVRDNKLDGMRLEMYGGQPVSLMHFKEDRAVGDWFDWGTNGTLRFHARFNEPCLIWDLKHWTGIVPNL